MKNFQCWSDKVRIALLGYIKPVRGLPDHRRLFFFSHVTNSIRVCLAPCVTYTYQRLSCKLICGVFNFRWCVQQRKFNRRKFLQTKIFQSTVQWISDFGHVQCTLYLNNEYLRGHMQWTTNLIFTFRILDKVFPGILSVERQNRENDELQ